MDARNEPAAVLDARPYRERDLLLSVLTPSSGVVRGVLRGARGRRHARGAAAAQVLSLVTASWWRRPSAELATFTDLDLVRSSYPLGEDLVRGAVGAAAAEVLLAFCPEGDPAPRHFRLAAGVLDALLAGASPAATLAYVLVWVLRLGGVFPEPLTCSRCGAPAGERPALAPADGHPLCGACAPAEAARLPEGTLPFLAATRKEAPSGPLPEPPPGLVRWLERLATAEAGRPLRAVAFARGLL